METPPPALHSVEAIRQALARSGLTDAKDAQIGGRLSAELIARAKERTGITNDSELLEVALGNLALEDRFPETFRRLQGTIDPDLELEV